MKLFIFIPFILLSLTTKAQEIDIQSKNEVSFKCFFYVDDLPMAGDGEPPSDYETVRKSMINLSEEDLKDGRLRVIQVKNKHKKNEAVFTYQSGVVRTDRIVFKKKYLGPHSYTTFQAKERAAAIIDLNKLRETFLNSNPDQGEEKEINVESIVNWKIINPQGFSYHCKLSLRCKATKL